MWKWGPRDAHIYGVCKFLWHPCHKKIGTPIFRHPRSTNPRIYGTPIPIFLGLHDPTHDLPPENSNPHERTTVPGVHAHAVGMRSHLLKCLTKGHLLPFPTLEKHSFRHNHFPYLEFEVFCNCLMPETYGDMVQCDECEQFNGSTWTALDSLPLRTIISFVLYANCSLSLTYLVYVYFPLYLVKKLT